MFDYKKEYREFYMPPVTPGIVDVSTMNYLAVRGKGESATVEAMERFAAEKGYDIDLSAGRLHHEIYLSDPRKADPTKLKTVIRHPVKSKKS